MSEPTASHAYTCPGNVRFLERKYAKRAAKKILRAHGDKMGPYRCTACGLWHLGHTPKPRRTERNAHGD